MHSTNLVEIQLYWLYSRCC